MLVHLLVFLRGFALVSTYCILTLGNGCVMRDAAVICRKLADNDQDGALTLHEFCVAMKLVLVRRKGHGIPSSLPESLVQLRKHGKHCRNYIS